MLVLIASQRQHQSMSIMMTRFVILLVSVQGEDEEGETDELVNSVLDEIGIDLDGLMVPAPGQQTTVAEQPQVGAPDPWLRPLTGVWMWHAQLRHVAVRLLRRNSRQGLAASRCGENTLTRGHCRSTNASAALACHRLDPCMLSPRTLSTPGGAACCPAVMLVVAPQQGTHAVVAAMGILALRS